MTIPVDLEGGQVMETWHKTHRLDRKLSRISQDKPVNRSIRCLDFLLLWTTVALSGGSRTEDLE